MQSSTTRVTPAAAMTVAAAAISSWAVGEACVTTTSKPSVRHFASANGAWAAFGVTIPMRPPAATARTVAGTTRPGRSTGTWQGNQGKSPAHATTTSDAPASARVAAAPATRGTSRSRGISAVPPADKRTSRGYGPGTASAATAAASSPSRAPASRSSACGAA